jgi:hypothetical protein
VPSRANNEEEGQGHDLVTVFHPLTARGEQEQHTMTTKTTQIHVRINPGSNADRVAHALMNLEPTDNGRFDKAQRTCDPDEIMIVTNSITGDHRTYSTHVMSYDEFTTGLIDWAEQALTHITDTPDQWLRNAVVILAGAWHLVDVEVDDWVDQVVAGYIVDTLGELTSEEAAAL